MESINTLSESSKLKLKPHWQDHRRSKRLEVGARIDIATIEHFWQRWFGRPQFKGEVCNISSTGLQLRVVLPIPRGIPLKIWVQVNYKSIWVPLKLRGMVVWSKPEGASGSHLIGVDIISFHERQMLIWKKAICDEIRHDETVT